MNLVYFIVILTALSEVFYKLSTNSIMPFLFNDEQLLSANSLSVWILNLALVIGPILGTFLYNQIGIIPILVVDAFSFFIVTGLNVFLKLKTSESKLKNKTNVLYDLKEGLRLISQNKDLLCATFGVGMSRFFINPFYAVGMPLIMLTLIKTPNYYYGISQTFMLVGTLTSPLLVLYLKARYTDATSLFISRIGKIFPFSILLILCSTSVIVFFKENITASVIFFSLICFLGMLFNTSGFTFLNAYFQRRVPRDYLGRFASTRFFIYSILEPLGMNFFGFLYGRKDISAALVFLFIGSILEGILLLRVRANEMNGKVFMLEETNDYKQN